VADRVLASLRLGSACVAEYADGAGLESSLAPRPHLHPIRTLGGRLVTDALPADHRWHLGLSVAVPDVGGWNFWGGPTYLRDRGYTLREDHGRIEHVAFTALADEGFGEQLRWLAPGGEPVLAEHRRVRAQPADSGWILEITTSLTNVSGGALALGSPATNGRPGAGYGGLFWRLPPTQEPSVRTDRAAGAGAVHGSVGSWLVWHDPAAGFTLALAGADDETRADPWFVRLHEYPGIGSQLAAREPLLLEPGGSATRGWRALVADGALEDDAVQRWAAETS
jgi:hypothetical protein